MNRNRDLGDAWDVAVVGLGPVGTTLAGLLGKRGLRVLGIDREHGIYQLPRAGHMDHTVLRTLGELGCLDEAFGDTIPNSGMRLVNGGGEVLAEIRAQKLTPSGLPASVHFHQPALDRTLRTCVEAISSATLMNGNELVGLEQDDGGVTLSIRSASGVRQDRAQFLVGCDGAQSAVRTLSGIKLIDFGFAESWVVIDLILKDRIDTLPINTTFGADPARPYAAIELPGMRYRFEFMLLPGETAEQLTTQSAAERLVSKWIDPSEIHRIERSVVYTFRGASADTWRKGRIMVAGDAAHLTPPFLGQGLCSGVRDVVNLAWKLDHVLRHGAPHALLDTYQTERDPHVRNVVNTSIELGKVLCVLDPKVAKERDEKLLNSGKAPDQRVTFKLGELVPGPLVLAGGGMFMISPSVDGVPLDELVGQRFLVLARDESDLTASAQWWTKIGARLATLAQLPTTDDSLKRWMDKRNANVVIVRPDRYVLAAGESLDAITAEVKSLLAESALAEP
jgi:3-(3-hydroxy-phenyl)propionate hydroxylase